MTSKIPSIKKVKSVQFKVGTDGTASSPTGLGLKKRSTDNELTKNKSKPISNENDPNPFNK